jgi:hypothetical protein
VLISDGAVHTGLGGVIDQSWDRDAVAGFLKRAYDGKMSAKSLCTLLLGECSARYGGMPMADTPSARSG